MVEQVEFTNMCMICDGNKVVVIDRKKRDWPGICETLKCQPGDILEYDPNAAKAEDE